MSAYTVTYQVSNVLVVHHVQYTQRVLLILSTPFGAMYSSSTGTVSASRKRRAEFVVALSPHTACLIAKTEFVCVPTVHLGGARSMQPRTLEIVACFTTKIPQPAVPATSFYCISQTGKTLSSAACDTYRPSDIRCPSPDFLYFQCFV